MTNEYMPILHVPSSLAPGSNSPISISVIPFIGRIAFILSCGIVKALSHPYEFSELILNTDGNPALALIDPG